MAGFSADGFREFLDEFDFAGIFVGGGGFFAVVLQLGHEIVVAADAGTQNDEGLYDLATY